MIVASSSCRNAEQYLPVAMGTTYMYHEVFSIMNKGFSIDHDTKMAVLLSHNMGITGLLIHQLLN